MAGYRSPAGRRAATFAAAQANPTLKPLGLEGSAKAGVASTIGIVQATPGSTITVQSGSLPPGMTLNSTARVISGTPTAAGNASFVLHETLANAVGSPKDTQQTLAVANQIVAPRVQETEDVWAPTRGIYGTRANGFSRAIARVRNRSGRARFGIVGDSLPAGAGAGTVTGAAIQPPAALRAQSYPSQLAGLLRAAGIPTRADAFVGTGNISNYTTPLTDIASYYAGSDGSSVSFGAGWTLGPANAYVYGGQMLTSPVVLNATAMTFTPGHAADSFDFTFHNAGGGGTWTVADADGTLGVITTTTAGTIGKATVTRATASKLPITITPTSGGQILGPISIEPYNSANPMLEIINMGGSGTTMQGWAAVGNNRSPIVGVPLMAFDALLITPMINDKAAARTDAQFLADLDAFTAAARSVSEVILTKSPKPHGSGTNPVSYHSAVDSVAASRGALAVVDFYNGLSLSGTGGGGDYFGNNEVHLTAQGYARMAALLTTSILALA